MMGSTTASCGHVLPDNFDGIMVWYKSSDCDAVEGFHPAVAYACYCAPCANQLASTEEWLPNQEAADAWLRSQRVPNLAEDAFNEAAIYLRDLSDRLMHVPATYDVDGNDVDRLNGIAGMLDR